MRAGRSLSLPARSETLSVILAMIKRLIGPLLLSSFVVAAFPSFVFSQPEREVGPDYQRSRYDPIHFAPAIYQAKDDQCLSCHSEVLEPSVRERSPAGLAAKESKAWYQFLPTYDGNQETFHRRHLSTEFALSVMQMKCVTCHQGNEPRDEMGATPPQNDSGFTLRKMVDPKLCLQCHGQMNYSIMGLPMPWKDSKQMFGNNCLLCHAAIRTNRHNVNYLKPAEIEKLAQEKGTDVCFGCHGGRAWYRITPEYPRHSWSGMAAEIPEWAKTRPTESLERFRVQVNHEQKN